MTYLKLEKNLKMLLQRELVMMMVGIKILMEFLK